MLVARLKADLGLADGDGAARVQEGLAHAHAVDKGAVGGIEVDEDVAGVFLDDLAVVARCGVVADDDVVVVHAADGDDVLAEAPLRGAAHDERAAAHAQGRAGVQPELVLAGEKLVEGVTIAVAWPPGVVSFPGTATKVWRFAKLNLVVRAENDAVAAFYAKLGFETEARKVFAEARSALDAWQAAKTTG